MIHRFLFFILMITYSAFSCIQAQKYQASLTSQQAIEDIEWLKNFIADVHIDPFKLYPENDWREKLDNLIEKFSNQNTVNVSKLFVDVLPVFHNIQDIHMSLFLYPARNDYLLDKNHYLVLNIRIFENALYSVCTTCSNIPVGSRIVSINQIPDHEIIRILRSVSPSDGANIMTKNRIAERNFIELFPLIFPVYESNTIEILPPESDSVVSVSYAGIILPKGIAGYSDHSISKNYHEVVLYDSLKTALLTVPSFSTGSKSDFSDFLQFAFGEIRKRSIENLIIDLRNNEGGYAERGEILLSYLIPEETTFFSNIVFKKSRMADEIFNEQSRNSRFLKRMYVLSELMRMDKNPYGTYDTVYYRKVKPAKHVFTGKIYVLINGLSVSTTGLLCNSLRENRGAAFIGEPGGFTPQGTFGQVISFTLPNSKISGFISTIRFNSGDDFTIDTIPFMPDVLVFETIDDAIFNHDPVLNKTIEIIRTKEED
jgi:hypothetical protein